MNSWDLPVPVPETEAMAGRRLVRKLRHITAEQYETRLLLLGEEVRSPIPGTPAHADWLEVQDAPDGYSESLSTLRQQAATAAELALGNMFDHLRQLHHGLNQNEPLLYAHASSARVMIEAAAKVCELLDPEASSPTRLLRAAAWLESSAKEDERQAAKELLADLLGQQVEVSSQAKAARTAVVELLKGAGITKRRGRQESLCNTCGRGGGVRYLVWHDGSTEVEAKRAYTGLVRDWFSALGGVYQDGSGTIHSVPWRLRQILQPSARAVSGQRVQVDLTSMVDAVDVALAACERALDTFGKFWGLDDMHEYVQKTQLRRAAVRVYGEDYLKVIHQC